MRKGNKNRSISQIESLNYNKGKFKNIKTVRLV